LRLGLGLDAGGTQTRWAVATAQGELVAEGVLPGLSGTQLATEAGRAAVRCTLAALAEAIDDAAPAAAAASATQAPAMAPRQIGRIVAGVTGFGDEHRTALHAALAAALGHRLAAPAEAAQHAAPAAPAVLSMPDIELACRAAFPAGDGIVLMAGTGSIAACLGADGQLHRAGGRGHLIDDAGSGHWIASRALRLVWRAEDVAPGSGQTSALGRRLAAAIGGGDWPAVRAWVYGASRGDIGQLALAVAEAAALDACPQALALLQQAGRALAQPVLALSARLSACPSVRPSARPQRQRAGAEHQQGMPTPAPAALRVATAGRVFDLHPAVLGALRDALPTGTALQRISTPAHHSAARIAAGAPLR
jgi:N-acetylglucosamine kinase-like BadF-type ATPase